MTITPEQVNAWFTPFHFFVYLGIIFVIMICWLQMRWDKESRTNILVLLQKAKGDGDYYLVPIDDNKVNLVNKNTGESKLWGINELSTITVPYPAIGFLPRFLLKQIKLVVLSDETWEPITNRSREGKTLVMTPKFIGNLVNEQITKALAMVNQEMLDFIKGIGKILNPTHFYVYAGISIGLLVWNLMLVSKLGNLTETVGELQAIVNVLKAGLGL